MTIKEYNEILYSEHQKPVKGFCCNHHEKKAVATIEYSIGPTASHLLCTNCAKDIALGMLRDVVLVETNWENQKGFHDDYVRLLKLEKTIGLKRAFFTFGKVELQDDDR